MNALISGISSLIASAFAALVLRQFLRRRRPYQAVWALALAFFSLGVFVEFVANLGGWTPGIYRLWFFFGGTLAAATLGLGSIYLLLPRRFAHAAAVVLALTALWAGVREFTIPIAASAVVPLPGQARPPSLSAIPADVTALVVALNVFGTIAVVGGAGLSFYRCRRRGDPPRRMWANALIAAGALIVAGSGSFAGLGRTAYLFIGELAGIAAIFSGFLCAEGILFGGAWLLAGKLRRKPVGTSV
jgi:hypothetical protein